MATRLNTVGSSEIYVTYLQNINSYEYKIWTMRLMASN